mgnify:CR=1 FL=1
MHQRPLVARTGSLEEATTQVPGVTKATVHTGLEAGMCSNPRTSVHPSGRETDVPVRDPVSTAHSTHRSHANRSPGVGVIIHNEWEDRGVGQKILLAVGVLMNWVATTTEENMHWPNGAFPTPMDTSALTREREKE